MTLDEITRQEARLIMLKALVEQAGYSASDALLEPVLETYGIKRGRAFVTGELSHLAEMGTVSLTVVGNTTIATLTRRGRDHVERRVILAGIKRPSPDEVMG